MTSPRRRMFSFGKCPKENIFWEVFPKGCLKKFFGGERSSLRVVSLSDWGWPSLIHALFQKTMGTKLVKKIGKFFCFETSMNFRSSYPPCSTFCQSFQTHRFVKWQLTFIKLQMRQNLIFAKFSYQVSGSIPSNGPHHQLDSPQISYLSYTILLNLCNLNREHKKKPTQNHFLS